jgi:DNA polymerase delta subunit 3
MNDVADDTEADQKAAILDGKEEEKPIPDRLEESVVVSNGRRRGRRRVMKKKTERDEEGYLGKKPSNSKIC